MIEYCIQGNICPCLISAPFALVVSGQIYDWTNSIGFHYLSLNTTASGRIQDGLKLFAIVEGQKLNGVEITLYTVTKSVYFTAL